MRCGFSAAAAASASSTLSPGMNAETDRRTKARLVACSRRNGEVDIARNSLRISDMPLSDHQTAPLCITNSHRREEIRSASGPSSDLRLL